MLTALCLSLLIPASAANVIDNVGSIYCDVMPQRGSYFNGGSPTNGGDTFKTTAAAIVSGRTAGETMNIYVRAYVVDPDSGYTYATRQSTEHYKTRTSATTDEVRRGWLQEELPVMSLGLARARYTNNKVSEDTGGGQRGTIGGEYLRSTNSADFNVSNNGITLGAEKGENMISVIYNVFGYDLSSYNYVSFAELWSNNQLTNTTQSIRKILTDACVEIESGERMPLGFLYKGNDVYTVVEQADSSLKLTKYEMLLPAVAQRTNIEEIESLPDYQIVDTEVNTAAENVVLSLYE